MQVLIVLGHRLRDDGGMTDILTERLDAAERAYKNGGIDKVIVSGGVANRKARIAEATVMKNALIARGLPTDVIIEENKSKTTRGNARLSTPIIVSLGAETAILCTSDYHINRKHNNPVKLFTKRLKKSGVELVILK